MPVRKRVLIDASVVTSVPDGLSIYVLSILRHLPDSSFEEFDFSLLVNPNLNRPDFWAALEGRPFRIIEERIAPIGPRRDLAMRRFFKRRGGEFDVVHITSSNYPMFHRGGVCTIHDLTFRKWFHNPGGIPGAKHLAVAYLTAMTRICLRRADRIISVSGSTRDELRSIIGASEAQMAKVRVVHEGWEHLDAYSDAPCDDFPHGEGGYLFYLGSGRHHKNLDRLLDAYALAAKDIPAGAKLIISGNSNILSPRGLARVAELNAEGERVLFTGFLSNGCVRTYYQHAHAFVFPSLAEGFGIPVLESFFYGTPLLCSNVTSLPEIAGDAALYFDPADTRSIADALIRIYAEPALKAALVENGRRRLAQFSWRKAAEETLAVYREAAEA